jgi:peroxidase
MVGPTFQSIIAGQFENLRDGDRFFFENQGFSQSMMNQIQNTTLSDLIVRDTDTTVMQPDAFVSTQRHASNVASPIPTAPQLVMGVDDDNAVIAGSPNVDNTIVAGLGTNQQLTGGGSSDRFVFLGPGHSDLITDFNPATDVLDFEQTVTPADFSNVIIDRAANGSSTAKFDGNTIQLAGLQPIQLNPAQFEFNLSDPSLRTPNRTG